MKSINKYWIIFTALVVLLIISGMVNFGARSTYTASGKITLDRHEYLDFMIYLSDNNYTLENISSTNVNGQYFVITLDDKKVDKQFKYGELHEFYSKANNACYVFFFTVVSSSATILLLYILTELSGRRI
jgi:hypothetical protein